MSRKCLNDRNNFCYVCAELTLKAQRRKFTPLVRIAYDCYFNNTIDQNKTWAPEIRCAKCVTLLTGWLKGSRHMLLQSLYGANLRIISQISTSAWQNNIPEQIYLGNFRSENYRELVSEMIKNYKIMGYTTNMCKNIHFLHSHLDFFPESLSTVSDEHGERFHQDIVEMERHYQRKWCPNTICWQTTVEHWREMLLKQSRAKNLLHKQFRSVNIISANTIGTGNVQTRKIFFM